MLSKKLENDLLYRAKINSIQLMQTKAENLLNPYRYHLSAEAKKRLRWLYVLYEECGNNVRRAANKIGVSRSWLSTIKSIFERSRRDPRCLEPESRAPRRTGNRQRISKETEKKILEIRDQYGWGKESISVVLQRDHGLRASPSTVQRYLHKHLRIEPKISERNKKAWLEKKLRDELQDQIDLKIKYRPPKEIKDYQPGALVEKDMKMVPTKGKMPLKLDQKYHLQDYFSYQHSLLDSFTRIKAMELVQIPDSALAARSYQAMKSRMPFAIASANTDSGGENGKHFAQALKQDEVIQFYSRTGTPTDNPRVERSHLTDDKEFYGRGYAFQTFEEQKGGLRKWEHTYNFVRPNQALGYLTPMGFYQLWKENPQKAYAIKDEYQAYLEKQRRRLASSRRLKNKEQIEKLMQFVDAKLSQMVDLKPYKLELIKCQLCSWT